MLEYKEMEAFMKSIGIVCEYNPMHNGHIYQIKKIRKLYPDRPIVIVLNGDFMQRGDISLIDKWKKTDIALNYADLIVELPFEFGTESADLFTKGACDILKALKVETIVFGSESGDIDLLKKIVEVQTSEKYNNLVKKYLDEGLSYPKSLAKALEDLNCPVIDKPNDLLGLGYVRNMNNSVTIKRTNDYNDINLGAEISSAMSIRKALENKIDIKNYVPEETYKNLTIWHTWDDYFDLLKYKIISDDDLKKYQGVDEGIENKIKKVINSCSNIDDLIKKTKSKRFTYNKLKRIFVHILCGYTKQEAKARKIEYVRILGFNQKGKSYLNEIKKECDLPIITKYDKKYEMLNMESRVSSVYNLRKKDDLLEEYQHKPIIF
jgi:predicted nucleotidyltransferase